MKPIFLLFVLPLLAVLGALPAAAQSNYYAQGVAHSILDDGSGNFPVAEAGEVYVGLSSSDAPQWTSGSHSSATATGAFSASGTSVTFHFWARAKAGYTFIGWGSTKTSKSASSGTESLEGKPWSSKTTLWTPGTAEQPKTLIRYAIFRRNAEEDTSGGGVAMTKITGATHTYGSTTNPWSVRINFAEPLAYKDFAGYGEGYGTNKGLIGAITCRSATDEIHATTANISGSPTAAGSDAYGLVYFPAAMPVGTYSVHLPKGLFTTASGQPTAAADFTVTVAPDTQPLTITSTTPTPGQNWDASPETQSKETDGNFSLVSLRFNKIISAVYAEGKDITLTNTTTGRVSRFSRCAVSATNDKHLGIIEFGLQPSGSYIFHLPAGVFADASGNMNAAYDLKFVISGSTVDPWALPQYSNMTPSIANNSTLAELSSVDFTLSRNGYAAPRALLGSPKVSAVTITATFLDGVDYSDPDNRPIEESTVIEGVTLRIAPGGTLRVGFAQPIRTQSKVVITIPEGSVINVPNASGKSLQELYEQDGCTNAAISFTVNIDGSYTTSIPTLEQAPDATTAAYGLDGRRISGPRKGFSIVGRRKVIVK